MASQKPVDVDLVCIKIYYIINIYIYNIYIYIYIYIYICLALTDKKDLHPKCKVSKGAKIRNRYNQVSHLTKDTNGKVINSQQTPQTRAKRSALCRQGTTGHK